MHFNVPIPLKCMQSCGREKVEMMNVRCVHVIVVQQLWGCCPHHHPIFSQGLIFQSLSSHIQKGAREAKRGQMFVVCHMIFLFLNFLFYLGQNSCCIFHECKPQTFPFLFHSQKQRGHRPVRQATTTKRCSFATIHVCFWFSLCGMTLSVPNSKAEQLTQDATGLMTFGMLFSVLFYICFQNVSLEK